MTTQADVEPLRRLPDGTVKQVSPLTGTTVWTLPGRAHRPLPDVPAQRSPVDPARVLVHAPDPTLALTLSGPIAAFRKKTQG